MKELTKIEEILLMAIWRLKDDAYGVKIRQYISGYLAKEFTYGNLYSALHQLVKKKGMEALQAARELHEKLWAGISSPIYS